MLNALYDYAVRHELSLPDGYAKKAVAAYISFSSKVEDYVEIHMGDDSKIICPDIGSKANTGDKCHVIVARRCDIAPVIQNAKSMFYYESLSNFAEIDLDAKLCIKRMSSTEVQQSVRAKLDECRVKDSDTITFMIDGRKLHDSINLKGWWTQYRKQFQTNDSNKKVPCLITGELTTPIKTAGKLKGLVSVGGNTAGSPLICFEKSSTAFQSYGLSQGENAPVSESAMGAVTAALNELLEDAPILCGMKFVHWYDRDIEKTDDPFFDDNLLGLGFGGDEEAEEENLEETELQARKKADRVIHAVQSSDTAPTLDAIYHILLLSGVGGRVMVRRYEMGEYETLQENLDKWNRDLALVHPYAQGLCKPLKLTGRLIRLLKYQKNDRKIFERLGKELSSITPAVLTAILGGGRLPDAVAIRALAYIRSKLLSDEDIRQNEFLRDWSWACQWLKVWLLRNHERSEEHLNEYYNPNHPEPAYHCGAAMAVYGEIQHKAMPEVNVNMAQRFYASCIQTPALVLGRLSQMSVHHLAKIENKFYQNLYRELLEQVHTAIGPVIPTTLNLEKQSYFALGYYQMYAKMRQDRMDAVNKNKEEA